MDPLSNDEVFLLVFDRLQSCSQVANLPLDGEHLALVCNIDDTVDIEAERLVADGGELIREAIRVSSGMLCGEGVGSCVLVTLFEQATVRRILQPNIDVQVTSTADLIRQRHLVTQIEILVEAVLGACGKLDHVTTGDGDEESEEDGA